MPSPPAWPEMLPALGLNLAAGVGDVEYLTNCIMLHNRLENELAEMTNFGLRDQQTKMLLKLGDAALKLSDTNKFPKQGNHRCNNLNNVTKVMQLVLVHTGLHFCMPQE